MKKKPIFTILIIFIIIIAGYFAFWKITTNKIKVAFEDELKKLEINFKDVGVSGFPFSKNIVISNLEFKNDANYLTQDILKIKKLIMSSFIFGNNYKVSLEDISYYDSVKKEEDMVKFNSEPDINLSLYKNNTLKSFLYKDTGYKITDPKNKELYSFGASNLEVYSTMLEDAYDYSIKASFSEIKNFSMLNKQTDNLKTNLIPDSYDLKTDLSLYFKEENEEIVEGSIKINNISLKNSIKNIQISLNGTLEMDKEDSMMSGNLKIQIDNFEKFTSTLLDNFMTMQQENLQKDPTNTQIKIKNFSNQIANVRTLAQKNEETTDTKAVFLIERKKNGTDYMVNNESLLQFLNEQKKQAEQEAEKAKLGEQQMEMEQGQTLPEGQEMETQGEMKEVPVMQEGTEMKETPQMEEGTKMKEMPAIQEAPKMEESTEMQKVPEVKEMPETQEVPTIQEAPAIQEAPMIQEGAGTTPTTEEKPQEETK